MINGLTVSLVAQWLKKKKKKVDLPMQEMWVPWRKKNSSILAWEIPWTEEPGRLQSMWSQRA